jgi:hypothetical protein
MRERKRIARLLLTDVTVTRTSDTITAHIRLAGGQARTLTLPVPEPAWKIRQTKASTITEIDKLLDHHTCAETAAILRGRGLPNGEGRPFTTTMVQRVIRTYQLPSRRQRLLNAGLIPLAQMAQLLGVSTGTVKTWHHAGLITGHPNNDKGQMPLPATRPQPASPGTRTQTQRTTPRPPQRRHVNPPEMSDPTDTVSAKTTDNRTPRINPKRCSMQPEVSLSGSAAGSLPPRFPRRALKSFGAFWYDFVIGDDWHVAAIAVAALALTALLVHVAGVNAWWLLPLAAFAALAWSLRRATSGKS